MTVPLRVRLALVFAVSFAALLALAATALYWQLRRRVLNDFDRGLQASAESARLLFAADRLEFPDPEARLAHILTELTYGDRTLVAFDSTGRRLATTRATADAPQLDAIPVDAPADQLVTATFAAGPARVLRIPLEGGVQLVIAMSMVTVERQLTAVRGTMLALLPLVLLVGGALGGWGAGFVLGPVHRLASLADDVGRAAEAGAVSFATLPDRQGHDEVGRVTRAFNRLVERTSSAIGRERSTAEEQRSFLADVAHELRTPVAIIRNEAEVALSSGDGLAAKEAALKTIADESARLGELVADLLFLARRAEATELAGAERLFLDDLANLAVGRIRKLKEAKGRMIEWSHCEAAPARGAASLLERAIMILLHNALVHAPGSRVEISTGCHQGRSWIRVRDFGPGVPAADANRIFQRFVRLGGDRPGTGLGLAIARAVASQHGGDLRLETVERGASFVLTLPADHNDQDSNRR